MAAAEGLPPPPPPSHGRTSSGRSHRALLWWEQHKQQQRRNHGLRRKSRNALTTTTRWFRRLRRLVLLLILLYIALSLYAVRVQVQLRHQQAQPQQALDNHDNAISYNNCAINFYGLPRSFESLVLPSILEHVVRPNLRYRCDYFLHHHQLENNDDEPGGRDGRGGRFVDPHAFRQQLPMRIRQMADHHDRKSTASSLAAAVPPPSIRIRVASTTETEFQERYQSLMHTIYHTNDTISIILDDDDNHTTGTTTKTITRPRYLPYAHDSYFQHPSTIVNIIKMWHGQQSVWNLMEAKITTTATSEDKSHMHSDNPDTTTIINNNRHYSRVGMFRNDVVYMTDFDIYRLPNGTMDVHNGVAVVPQFAQHPVNDRYVAGPYDAVRIWAAERFARLEMHADWLLQQQHDYLEQWQNATNSNNSITDNIPYAGDGIHSERFLAYTIFPAIRQYAGVEIQTDPHLCCLRARADESIRLADCGYPLVQTTTTSNDDAAAVEHTTTSTIMGNAAFAQRQNALALQNQQAVEYLIGRKCIRNATQEARQLIQLECQQQQQRSGGDDALPHAIWNNNRIPIPKTRKPARRKSFYFWR